MECPICKQEMVEGGRYTNNQGYCCEKCKKIIAVVSYEKWF